MKHDKLILYGSLRDSGVLPLTERFRAGYLLLAIAVLALLFPRFRQLGYLCVAALMIAVPFALELYLCPRCIAAADRIMICRGRRTIRTARLDALTAIGRCHEGKTDKQLLFFCTASRKELRSFAHAHDRDCAAVACDYGYTGELTEAEQWRVTVTVYLRRKGSISNEKVAKICLTDRAWKKLMPYCEEHRLELLELSVL